MKLVKPRQFGVTPLADGKFQARVSHGGKRHFLGNFSTEQDASDAVQAFLAQNGVERYELLSQSLVDELHPTLNGAVLTWPYKGSNDLLWWLCPQCGRSWEARVFARTSPSHPSGCPDCGNARKSLPLAQAVVDANFLARGFTLLEPYTDSNDLLLVRHNTCGEEYRGRYRTIVLDGHGCPKCAKSGYDPTKPGYIYLLKIPAFKAIKIGVSNAGGQRLATHKRSFDFDIVETWGPMDGGLAPRIEAAILSAWRSAGLQENPHLKAQFKMTETANLDEIDVPTVIASVDLLASQKKEPFDPARFSVGIIPFVEGDAFFRNWHYTGTSPRGLTTVGLKRDGFLVGVAGFGPCSYPGVQKAVWGGDSSNTVEIRRFALVDNLPSNTASWFMSQALRLLDRSIEVVVAFSDPGAGHHGGMYQACNFVFLGTTRPAHHYVDQFGAFVHKRVVWEAAKRNGLDVDAQATKNGLVKIADPPKNRYAIGLSRRAQKALAAKALAYPKPASCP
jgi:hypothetical protein